MGAAANCARHRRGRVPDYHGAFGSREVVAFECARAARRPVAGEYWFRDEAVHAMGRKQRAALAKQNIGMVFQSYHLLDDLTVQENIDLPLSYKNISRKEREALVADTLDKFSIVGKKTYTPRSFPEASSNWSALHAPSFISLPCCLPTSQPETFIRRRLKRSWSCFAN